MTALPASRIPSPVDAPALRWGIMGPGRIADVFARSLCEHTRQRLSAVASRSEERGAEFARRHGIPRVHASYEALAADPDIDVIYIATPNPFHARCALLAIEARKHVVVEKPFAMDGPEAERVAEAAARRGVFAMEAMWPRFLPAMDVVRQVLADGLIGEPRALVADLGEYFPPDPQERLFDPALGGGALYDLGVYLVSFASFVLGGPDRVLASGSFTDTGVDAQSSIVLRGPGGRQAHLFTTLEGPTGTAATITGTAGVLRLASPFYLPGSVELIGHPDVAGASRCAEARFPQARPDEGLCFEAAEAARCIASGAIGTPLMPLAETVDIAHTMDRIRNELIKDSMSI